MHIGTYVCTYVASYSCNIYSVCVAIFEPFINYRFLISNYDVYAFAYVAVYGYTYVCSQVSLVHMYIATYTFCIYVRVVRFVVLHNILHSFV